MEYISLKILFHMNEKQCEETYLSRFNSEFAHKLNIFINDYECFYVVNEELMNLLISIERINSWVETIVRSKEFPEYSFGFFTFSSLIEEIRSSNKIEGIHSTRKEIKDLVNKENPKQYKRFYGMVNKYNLLKNEKFKDIENCSDIRKLYDEILLKDILNEDKDDYPDGLFFRTKTVEISSGVKVLHQGMMDEKKIIENMDKSLKILNDESIAAPIRISLFHYLFEYIHPFYNGNGRMGRFIASGYLSKYYNILCAFQLSIACKHNNKKYYEAFEITNDIRNKADLTPFIINFLEIYFSGLQELQSIIKQNLAAYYLYENYMAKLVDKDDLCVAKVLLQSTIFGRDGLSLEELANKLEFSEVTLRKKIKNINSKENLIEIDNSHKPYKYSISKDFLSKY